MRENIIELIELTKTYGNLVAVNRLTLQIKRGEVFGLLGPNGAGKSTTILMMLGLTEPDSGSVKVCGIDSTRQPIQVKQKVGYLPDDVGFYEDRTGLDNLLFTARLNHIPEDEARQSAIQLLEKVGLKEAAHQRTGTYSRGMRQRLGLADVMIKNPEVIILDEPTLGIDPKGVRELLVLIRQLSRDLGVTVLLSSHHLHQVQEVCDRVGLFVGGKLIAAGDIKTLSRNLFQDEPITIEIGVATSAKMTASDVTLNTWIEQLKNHEHVLGLSIEHHVNSENKTNDDPMRNTNSCTLQIKCSEDITSNLAKSAIHSGIDVEHLRKEVYGLDDIYHRYFEGGIADGK